MRNRSKNIRTQPSNKNRGKGEIRIIAGQWRGRKLPVLDKEGLRPTTDRIKETVFNWLMPYILDSRCLDCFAGSGSLGIEALSRQAKYVQFFELDKQVAKQLEANLIRLQTQSGKVQQGDSLQHLKEGNQDAPYELVFLDPPFNKALLQPAIQQLEDGNWIAQNSLIYIEKERSLDKLELPPHWELLKHKQAGEVSFSLYIYNKEL